MIVSFVRASAFTALALCAALVLNQAVPGVLVSEAVAQDLSLINI